MSQTRALPLMNMWRRSVILLTFATCSTSFQPLRVTTPANQFKDSYLSAAVGKSAEEALVSASFGRGMATSTGGDYENSYDSNSGSRDLLKPSSRRHALATTGAFFAANALGVFGFPNVASARLKGPASAEELDRLVVGYKGLVYLLDNFDQETTKCTPECNRNPDAVRSYLGLRSMTHPLYQIEKVLEKAQDNLEDVDALGDFIDAVESYSSCISESNAMAYTSSFGEYNPGGGKDQVRVRSFLALDRELVDVLDLTRGANANRSLLS
jgi:hypothetical protein